MSDRHSSVAGAQHARPLEQAPNDGISPSLRQLPPHINDGPTPLSVVQEQLWYFSQLAPDVPVYNQQFVICKEGAFDAAAATAAFTEITRRHQILRSTFSVVDGTPMQIVQPVRAWDRPLVDLSAMNRARAEQEATRIAAEDALLPYDLEHGPLVRLLLIRVAEDHHRICVALHHLVFDGTCRNRILVPELIALYDDFAAGRPASLPDPPVQYADYATWSRGPAHEAEVVRRLDYWRQLLKNAAELTLPLDYPRPSEQRFRGATLGFDISAGLADDLRSVGRSCGATMFQVMASAFSILLQRYSGQDDVVFGIIADLRELPELRDLVGYCVNPLVVHSDLTGNPTFIELLGRVRDSLLGALAHRVPFERVVRELQPHRERGANPIFQVALVMQPPATFESLPDTTVLYNDFSDGPGQAKFDLSFELRERFDRGIHVRIVYDVDLFDPETIRRMLGHWTTLLESVAAAPRTPVADMPMLSNEERHLQLVEWNATEAAYADDACLHELVGEQARQTPDATAVSDGKRRLTFAELDDRAGRLASRLGQLGVGPDVLVGVCLQRSVDLVVALLGILKAGGAFVPLEPDQPRERLALMLGEAQPAVVVTTSADSVGLPPTTATVVRLDAERRSWMSHSPVVNADCRPDNLAYVLFTSGSTGTPKGVMIEHRSLVNQLVWMSRSFDLTPADRILHKTPLGFDPALWEIFCPLMTGASLTLLGPGDHADPRRLAEIVAGERITVLSFVPSMLEEFLNSHGDHQVESVRLVTAGGETVTAALAGRFFDRFGADVELRNMYGPTEAVITASWWRCDPGSERPLPIGRPVANTQLYVLDDHSRPLPTGAVGELCIGGVQVARGYLNRPDLTAECFVANPFVPGDRIYRTGDMVRYRNDGAIEFLGRADDQIKIRGVRVELGEIEAAMARHPCVRQAAAAVQADADGEPRLVAYLATGDGEAPNVADMRAFLAMRLPTSMVPSAVVVVDRIPLNGSGKTDRLALPKPDWRAMSTSRKPRSPIEARVASLWARTLRVPEVGLDDDFFDLGGHSLLAVRLLAAVEREFGVAVPLAAFFDGSATVAGMIAVIEMNTGGLATDRVAVPIRTVGSAPVLFFVQPGESAMLTMRHFTPALDANQRIIGLLPDQLGAHFDQSRSVEDLAATMIRKIREAQPEGPYYIAGYSFGGILAYEVATQLRAYHEEVAWLAVLDCVPPLLSRHTGRRRQSLRARLHRQRERGIRGSLRKTREVARRELTSALVSLHLRSSRLGDDFDRRGAGKLASRYLCPGNDAPMELFVTAEGQTHSGSRSLGWEQVHRGPLRLHEVPGGHDSMVSEPYVHILADTLAQSLRRAQCTAIPSTAAAAGQMET